MIKKPIKHGDLWEDYKQIYLDFGLSNDLVVKDRVLFINSLDADLNIKQEELKVDRVGYFMIDVKSKPARPLVEGLPLTYDSKEKEYDLKDKGGVLQFNRQKKEVIAKEMPVTILVPNPRSMYGSQISFASIAKTVMTLSFLGQRRPKQPTEEEGLLIRYLNNIWFLQEFSVKV